MISRSIRPNEIVAQADVYTPVHRSIATSATAAPNRERCRSQRSRLRRSEVQLRATQLKGGAGAAMGGRQERFAAVMREGNVRIATTIDAQ
jgi:hypothetical protein